MERMVVRSEDYTIMLRNPTAPSHVVFKRDCYNNYCYDSSTSKIAYYVFSLLELLFVQCGYLTWDDFRE